MSKHGLLGPTRCRLPSGVYLGLASARWNLPDPFFSHEAVLREQLQLEETKISAMFRIAKVDPQQYHDPAWDDDQVHSTCGLRVP